MDILYFIELAGIISFALSGFLISIKHNLDLLGIFLISFLTALGGGIIRDSIVGRIPYAFVDETLFILVFVTVIISIIFKLHKKENLDRKMLFVFSDSLGLVSFSISGALIGIEFGVNYFGVVMLSFITAIGGGIIRDVLINHIPLVLTKDFYGIVSIIVATLVYGLHLLDMLNGINILVVFSIGLGLRVLSIKYSWRLPKL